MIEPLSSNKPSFVIPHGHYREVPPTTLSKNEARKCLGVPTGARVITFCGAIRPYKNIPALIDAFLGLPYSPDDRLLIAGRVDQAEVLEKLLQHTKNDSRIRILSRLLSEEEVKQYVRGADLVVLPYRRILNSGSAILALSHDRPVLVPPLGSMLELQQMVGRDWVIDYEGELSGPILEKALAAACQRSEDAAPNLSPLEWDRIARQTIAAYECLLSEKVSPPIPNRTPSLRTKGA